MARHCSMCGEVGHYAKKCPKGGQPKVEIVQKTKGIRRCTLCHEIGHNMKTCPRNDGLSKYIKGRDEKEPGFSNQVDQEYQKLQTKREEAHRLLELERVKAERIEVEGIKPKKGYWIINESAKKVAGKISYIKKDGTIVWQDIWGTFVESKQETIINNHYKYIDNLETFMLKWDMVGFKNLER